MDIIIGTNIDPNFLLSKILKEETEIVSEDMKMVINPSAIRFAKYSAKWGLIIIALDGDYDVIIKMEKTKVKEVKVNW